MAVANNTQLVAALARGRATDVLGTLESVVLDFKREPYVLTNEKGKWELAKDVAAMANKQGGLIVIGVETDTLATAVGEFASRLRPLNAQFSAPEVAQQITQVVRSWIYPAVSISVDSYPEEQPGYYLVITIEQLDERDRYAMLRKTISEDGKVRDAVAVPIRDGDSTRWLAAEEIHRLLNDGVRSRSAPRFQNAPAFVPAATAATAQEALGRFEQEQGWDEDAVLYWQSWPHHPGPVPRLFASDGVKAYLDGQDVLRSRGFHFQNLYESSEVTSIGLVLPSRDGLAVEVQRSGLVTAGVVANRRLLGRGQDNAQELRISSLVLTELTYEFFRLVDEQVAPLLPGAQWTHQIVVRRMKSREARLSPGGYTQDVVFAGNGAVAVDDERVHSWTSSGSPRLDAFEALRGFYEVFGLDAAESNPWLVQDQLDVEGFVADVGL